MVCKILTQYEKQPFNRPTCGGTGNFDQLDLNELTLEVLLVGYHRWSITTLILLGKPLLKAVIDRRELVTRSCHKMHCMMELRA